MGTAPIVLLVRHAHTLATDYRLVGRMPAIHLSDRGQAELSRLQRQLAAVSITAVYSSPLVRSRDTAAAIAATHGLAVDVEEDLNEFDFGEWTGETFERLATDSRWNAFNARRSSALVPNGERPATVQLRIVMLLTRLAERHSNGIIALVSHAEVIRCAILWFAGRSLDDFHRVNVDTASVTAIQMCATPRVLFVNATDHCDLTTPAVGRP